MGKFIIADGIVMEREQANLTHLFLTHTFSIQQKMWFGYAGIPFFDKGIHLLLSQAEELNLSYPELFNNRRELYRLVKRMLHKNRFYRSEILNVQIY